MSQSRHFIEPSGLIESTRLLTGSYSVSPLLSLSVLELTLVIAAHHLTTLSEREPFNFEMVYSGEGKLMNVGADDLVVVVVVVVEYKKFTQRSQSAKFCDKKVAMKVSQL